MIIVLYTLISRGMWGNGGENPPESAVWNVSDTGRSQYDTGRSQMKTKSQKNPSASAISSTPPSEKNRF